MCSVWDIHQSHPEKFKFELTKDSSRIVRIHDLFERFENDDYLIIQFKRFSRAHSRRSWAEGRQTGHWRKGSSSATRWIEKGWDAHCHVEDKVLTHSRHLIRWWGPPNMRQQKRQIKPQRQQKPEKEVSSITEDKEHQLKPLHGSWSHKHISSVVLERTWHAREFGGHGYLVVQNWSGWRNQGRKQGNLKQKERAE